MDLIVVLIGIFLMNDDTGHFFVFLFSIHLSCKVLVWPNFQPWVLFLFLILLSFVSSSYSLGTSTLSILCFENMFFQSMACFLVF